MPPPTPLEKEVQSACLDWLNWWGAKAFRVNSGGAVIPNKGGKGNHLVLFVTGLLDDETVSDILGVLPDGRFLACEVKRPGHRTDPERLAKQRAFLRRVEELGGVGVLVESLDELRADLADAGYQTDRRAA